VSLNRIKEFLMARDVDPAASLRLPTSLPPLSARGTGGSAVAAAGVAVNGSGAAVTEDACDVVVSGGTFAWDEPPSSDSGTAAVDEGGKMVEMTLLKGAKANDDNTGAAYVSWSHW
jgi:hypothetical protein